MAAQLRVRTSAVRSVATPLSIPFQPRPIENPEQFYPTPLYTASAGYLVGCGHTKLSRACHANSFGGRTGGTLAYTQCIGHSTTFVCNSFNFLFTEPFWLVPALIHPCPERRIDCFCLLHGFFFSRMNDTGLPSLDKGQVFEGPAITVSGCLC